ncbi:MAG TPA: hypothetical protein VG889_01660 [Rhizomicrobium sp.]|nr:hypothetical protein [Rhizomicrobium sp.]
MNRFTRILAALPLCVATAAAQADVTISPRATAHMNCTASLCTATGAKAFLNVDQLQTMLAAGDVTVKGTAVAPNIVVTGAVSFSSAHTLTLDAYRSVVLHRTIDVLASGGLSVLTNDGGTNGVFLTAPRGNVHFRSLSGSLAIDGHAYTLVGSLSTLASQVASVPGGYFALAADADAEPDGEYALSPVTTPLAGRFDGLGNNVLNMTIRNANKHLGLFAEVAAAGAVQNLTLKGVHIHATGPRAVAGAVAAVNNGTLRNVHLLYLKVGATGQVSAYGGSISGINNGTILLSSGKNLPQNGTECGGGLVGLNTGLIGESYTEGKMFAEESGGIACINTGTIRNIYTFTSVGGRFPTPYPGGIVADNQAGGTIATSFAAGQITAAARFGGVAGNNSGTLGNVYWDMDYTGASETFGCGSGSCAGATPLTHEQIQGAMPAGFDTSVWTRSAGVNDGYPYLIDNPPR